MNRSPLSLLLLWCLLPLNHPHVYAAHANDTWIRPATTSSPLTWGRRDGIVFGLPGNGGMGGPRGLIRVGVMDPQSTRPYVINFIAIEPVTTGTADRFHRMAFSELEPSTIDTGKNGKRLWTPNPTGEFSTSPTETLSVRIEVEPFSANRAHVWLLATMTADHPDELKLTVHHHDDSAPIDELTLTATMGNKERLRQLWLRDTIIDSRTLYAGFTGNDFTEREPYPASRMLRWNGDPLALATTDESDPSVVHVPGWPSWEYQAPKLTQYWRIPAADAQPNLVTRVNGRHVYWLSNTPIPGGTAFENFELRQLYVPSQSFIFGMTRKLPSELTPPILTLPAGNHP